MARDVEYFEHAIAKQLEFAGDSGVYEERLAAIFLEGASAEEGTAFWQALGNLVQQGWISVEETAGKRVYRRWPKEVTAAPTP